MGKMGKVSFCVLMVNCVNGCLESFVKLKKDNWESCKFESYMRINDFQL